MSFLVQNNSKLEGSASVDGWTWFLKSPMAPRGVDQMENSGLQVGSGGARGEAWIEELVKLASKAEIESGRGEGNRPSSTRSTRPQGLGRISFLSSYICVVKFSEGATIAR